MSQILAALRVDLIELWIIFFYSCHMLWQKSKRFNIKNVSL